MIKKAIVGLAMCAAALTGQVFAADEPAWYVGGGAGRGEAKSPSSWAGQTDAALATVGVTRAGPTAVHVSDERPGPGVDTPEDLERVRRLIAG